MAKRLQGTEVERLDLTRLQWIEIGTHAPALPPDPGVYQLYLDLANATVLEIGRLGRLAFPAGLYVYTGSALGGLRPRLARHLRREKRHHWHIDHLLDHAE